MSDHQTPNGRHPFDAKDPASELLAQLPWARLVGGGGSDFPSAILDLLELPPEDLVRQVRADLLQRWQLGEPVPLEAYLEQLPTLSERRPAVLDLIETEMRLREQTDLPPTLDEFQLRFPDYADKMAQIFATLESERTAEQPTPAMPPEVSALGLDYSIPLDPLAGPDARRSFEQIELPPPESESDLPSLPPAWTPTRTVAGYEVLADLGSTPVCATYRVKWEDGAAVLKQWSAIGPEAEALRGRLGQIRAVLANMNHPNVAPIYRVSAESGRSLLVREHLSGNLAELLQGTSAAPRPAAALVSALASALEAAHERGLVHGRIKPANVLFAWDRPMPPLQDVSAQNEWEMFGTVRLSDFSPLPPTNRPIAPGVGEPARSYEYWAPEQVRGRADQIGPTTDVYALGVLLYELLTGRPPFRSALPAETLRQIADERPVPPTRWQPRVPPALEAIVLRCLEKEPTRRYPSAAALASDLEAFLSGRTVAPLRPLVEGPSPRRRAKRRRRLLVLIGAATTVGAVALAAKPDLLGPWHLPGPNPQGTQLAVARPGRQQPTRAEPRSTPKQVAQAPPITPRPRDTGTQVVGATVPEPRGTAAPTKPPIKPPEVFPVVPKAELAAAQAELAQVRSDLAATRSELTTTKTGLATAQAGLATAQEQIGRERLVLVGAALAARQSAHAAELLAAAPAEQRGWAWHVLNQQLAVPRLMLAPNEALGRARSVAASADGSRLVTVGTGPRSLLVWDGRTGQLRHTLAGHGKLALSADGRWLAALGEDTSILLYDLKAEGEAPARTLAGHMGPVRGLAFNPKGDRLASASDDGTIRLWPTAGGSPATLPEAGGPVTAVAFNPSGVFLAGLTDGRVRFWQLNADGSNVLHPFVFAHPQRKTWTALAWAPDDRSIVTAGSDQKLYQWELSSGKVIRQFDGPTQAVAFSPDSQRLAAAGSDGEVRLWNAATGTELGRWEGLNSVAFVGTDGLLAPQHDRHVAVWDTHRRPGPEVLAGHTGRVRAVAVNRDGKLWASGGDDGQVILWDAKTKQRSGSAIPAKPAVQALAFSPDGAWLAIASGELRLVSLTGQRDVPLHGAADTALGLAFSPDGRTLAAAEADGTVHFWDVPSGRSMDPVLRGHRQAAVGVAFSTDGRQVAAAGADGTVRVWQADDGRAVATLDAGQPMTAVAFSPDGRHLVAAGRGGAILVWNVKTWQEDSALLGHGGAVSSLAFHPDGRLLSAAADGTVRIWDVAAGRELFALTQPDGATALALGDAGRCLVTGGDNGAVRAWTGAPGK